MSQVSYDELEKNHAGDIQSTQTSKDLDEAHPSSALVETRAAAKENTSVQAPTGKASVDAATKEKEQNLPSDLLQAIERLEAVAKNDSANHQSVESLKDSLGVMLESLKKLVQEEQDKYEELNKMCVRLEGLYARELSFKRRSVVPQLWWRLGLASVSTSLLTVIVLFILMRL